MKISFLRAVLVVALLLYGCSPSLKFTPSASSIDEKSEDYILQRSILLVKTIKEDTLSPTAGTCFIMKGEKGIYFVTTYHVVENAKRIYIFFNEDRNHFGHLVKIVGFDKLIDVALLAADSLDKTFDHALYPLPLGDSDELLKAQNKTPVFVKIAGFAQYSWVKDFADIQNPNLPGYKIDEIFYQARLIVTDAKINFGHSGGPLMNLKNEVVAINVGLAMKNPLGLSIPINDFKKILPELEKGGELIHATIGVSYMNSWELQREYYLRYGFPVPSEPGAMIVSVKLLLPAYLKGLQVGDIIAAYNDMKIKDIAQLLYLMRMEMRPNVPIKLTILRGKNRFTETIVPAPVTF